MTSDRAALDAILVLALCLGSAVFGLGCESAPVFTDGPLVRDATTENSARYIIDETTVPTKQLHGEVQELPGEPAAGVEEPVAETPAEEIPAEPAAEKVEPEVEKTDEVALTPVAAAENRAQELAAPAVSTSDLVGPGPDYKINPGDLLEFVSLDDASLSRMTLVVRPDGWVSLPFIPDVKIAGNTRQEATDIVKAAYSSIYKEPQISLSVVEAVSRTYYVLGEVQAPNEYPYTRPVSVLSAITKAGGPRVANPGGGQTYTSRQGQLVKAFIIRTVEGERTVFSVDLSNLTQSGPHPSNTPVLPGDIIFVPEGLNLVYMMGEIGRPDVLPLQENMTMLQVLAASAGPRFSSARLREVVLMREIDATRTRVLIVDVKQMLKTGQDFLIKPGDIIYLPRKRLTIAEEFVSRLYGTVSPLMSLYSQAWATYYTDDQFEAIVDSPNTTDDLLGLLQGASNIIRLLPGQPTP